jgi:type I site-specific restriction endonuclease
MAAEKETAARLGETGSGFEDVLRGRSDYSKVSPVTPNNQPDTSAVALRAYQSDVIKALRAAVARGVSRLLLVAPTGAGKTVIAAALIANAVERGRRVLFRLLDAANGFRVALRSGCRAGWSAS